MSKSLTCTPENWEVCFNIAYLLSCWFLSPLSIVEDTGFVTPQVVHRDIDGLTLPLCHVYI
jgi:hypothetical protein